MGVASRLLAQENAGILQGQVLDAATGKPVDGALVSIFVDGRIRGASLVGADGRFTFSNIEGDSVRLSFEALGFEPHKFSFTVDEVRGHQLRGRSWALLMAPVRLTRSATPPTAQDSARAPVRVIGDWISSIRFAPQARAQAQRAIGRPGAAMTAYRRVLDSLRTAGAVRQVARTLLEFGELYRSLGRLDSALVLYRDALFAYRVLADVRAEASALHSIARVQMVQGPRDSAWINLQRALQMRMAVADTGGTLESQRSVAAYLFADRQYDSAQAYLENVLAATREDLRPGVLLDLAHVMRSRGLADSALRLVHAAHRIPPGGNELRAEILVALGMAYLMRETRDPRRASAYFDSAAAVYAYINLDIPNDASRVSFGETTAPLYELWTLTELLRSSQVGESAAVLAALAVTERGRAQALRRLMQTRTDTLRAGADLAAEGKQLVEAVTAPKRAVLSYMVTANETVTWLLAPEGLELAVVEVGADSLASLVTSVRDAHIRGGDDEPYAGILGRTLLPARFHRGLSEDLEVVVVPHGPIALLPFAALTLSDGSRIVDRHSVRFAPSLTVLRRSDSQDSSPTDRSVAALIIGNPRMPIVPSAFGAEVIALRPLPYAEREADSVAAILRAPGALKGVNATESAVRRQLPSARLVHFATHGYAYPEPHRARSSFIALAESGDDDGVLTVSELLDDRSIQLNAELVVLSACETGLGDLKQAEGVVGLPRSFMAKGARSVVSTLWQVSDEATVSFMTAFYRAWYRDGLTKGESLRLAQNHLRQSTRFTAPRYWAAFQLLGAN